MPSTRLKVKSAAAVASETKLINTQNHTQPTLLKIESVVPTLSNRSHKFIHRSHSTLSPSYFKHKINSKIGSNLIVPNLPEENIDETYNNTVIFHNGNYKIKRSPNEKEKFPDRINLDRRGLIFFPFIENETNLRLLSLQHNLINVLQIPLETETILNNQNVQEVTNNKPLPIKQPQVMSQKSLARNINNDNRVPLGTNITNLTTLAHKSGNQFISPLGQKTLILTVNQKNLLKKSKSFIQNYFPSGPNGLRTKTDKTIKNKLLQMTSFSADDIHKKLPNSDIKAQNISYSIQSPRTVPGFSLSLKNLVFLDLYDNQIDKISNLDGLKSLTVLLLGKNRIVDITGIVSLKSTLRVLDLHGNKITNISQKICQLQELKSLNLAGNSLRQIGIGDFAGLFSLKELNLKRNRIKKMYGFDDLRNLERLWLCHNDLQKVEDMSCVAKASNLKEVTIENNPVTLAGDCVSFLVSYLPNLILLSQMQVTEQVRRAAMAWRKNKEISDSNFVHLSTDVCHNIRREEVISNARTSWELLRSQQVLKNPKIEQEKVTHITDTNNPISENIQPQKRIIRQKTISNNTAKNDNTPIIRSSSQDNSFFMADNVADEFFRLPPILTPFIEQNVSSDNTNSTNSSLGPNIDSSSSYYSSDNEEQNRKKLKKLEKAEKTDEKNKCVEIENNKSNNEIYFSDPTIVPEQIIVADPNMKILDDIQTDKTSNISTISIKTSSESSATTSSEEPRSQKIKSANPNKKYFSGSLIRAQTAKSNFVNNGNNVAVVSANIITNIPKLHKNTNEREREQGGDYLIEICGRYLNVYGLGALKFIDKQWNIQKANDVHTIKFSYINFNSIASVLYRIKVRFPNAENFLFQETNITCFGQLNAIAEVQGIRSLIIESDGNPICTKDWKNYAIYRLSHWGLKQINGNEITPEEIKTSESMYMGLSDLVVWSLPDSLLQPLLARLRLEESCLASKMTAKEWLLNADSSLKCVVGKEALQWKKTSTLQDDINTRQKGCNQLTVMMENTCNAVEKLQKLEILWPNMLVETIRNTLLDYSQLDVYVKNLMSDIMN